MKSESPSHPLVEAGGSQHAPTYPHLLTAHDSARHIFWYFMKPEPRACFTPELLGSLSKHMDYIDEQIAHNPDANHPHFAIVGSAVPGIFNLGGDLDKFSRYIETQDEGALRQYGRLCVDLIYRHQAHHLNKNLLTISLIQGDAMGGGFECGISANFIVAEKGAKMGMPESLFNLFPGMGAFSLLSRRLTFSKARDLIVSGKVYSAEDMYDMGLVDELAEPGRGIQAAEALVDRIRARPNTFLSVQHIIDRFSGRPSREEMTEIVDYWAKQALNCREKDLRMMRALVRRQDKK